MNLAMMLVAQASRRRIPAVGGTAPAFVGAPSIDGTPTVGTPATYTAGSITGTAPVTVTRQWKLDGANISGATGLTYTPVTGDIGHTLTVQESLSNAYGGPITSGGLSAGSTVIDGSGSGTAPVDAAGPLGGLSLSLQFEQEDRNADGSVPLSNCWGCVVDYGTTQGGPYPYRKVLQYTTPGTKTVAIPTLAANTYYGVVKSVRSGTYAMSPPSGEFTKASS